MGSGEGFDDSSAGQGGDEATGGGTGLGSQEDSGDVIGPRV